VSMHEREASILGRIAEEAYLYLFPLVLMDVTRRVVESFPAGARPGFGPMNLFTHMRAFPPGDFREVVRPNFDTLYSTLWFDLRSEPVVVSAPDTAGRYYMLPMLDMWTDVFAVVGSRTTGTSEGKYALVAPGWDGGLPDGIVRIESPTPFGWIIGRTQTNGSSDYEAVHRIQDGFIAKPLSVFPGEFVPEEPVVSDVDVETAPLDQVMAMDIGEFFSYAAELMQLHPPHLTDQPILARMSRLGMKPGESFSPDPGLVEVIQHAPKAAQKQMADFEPKAFPLVNGWSVPTFGMGVYGTDYLRRATVAKIGLGANLPEDAIYPVLYHDEDGAVPDGTNSYVLHFDADALPPAAAFWSVTMYDAEGFPVPNDLDRYALGDRDPLIYNDDGSLDIYIQHDDPGGGKTQNWLPGPREPLGVTMRVYSPRREALQGGWVAPPLRRT